MTFGLKGKGCSNKCSSREALDGVRNEFLDRGGGLLFRGASSS